MQLPPLPATLPTIAPLPAGPAEAGPAGFDSLLAAAIGAAPGGATLPAPAPDADAEALVDTMPSALPQTEMVRDPLVPDTRWPGNGAPPEALGVLPKADNVALATPFAAPVPPLPALMPWLATGSSAGMDPETTVPQPPAIGRGSVDDAAGTPLTPSSVAASSAPSLPATAPGTDDTEDPAGGSPMRAATSLAPATGSTAPAATADPPESAPRRTPAHARHPVPNAPGGLTRTGPAVDSAPPMPADRGTVPLATPAPAGRSLEITPAPTAPAVSAPAQGPAAPTQAVTTGAAAAVATTIIRSAEPKGQRAAAPSLQAAVVPEAALTLNAATAAGAAPAEALQPQGAVASGAVPAPPERVTPSPKPPATAPATAPATPPSAETVAPSDEMPPGAKRAEAASPPSGLPGKSQGQPTGEPPQPATGQASPGPGLGPGPASDPLAMRAQAHATPRPPSVPVSQQIMPVIVTLAAAQPGAPGAVTVTLDPVELGRIEVTVRTGKDAHARIHVVAERPETLLLLLRDQAALDRAMAQAGIGTEGRTLSFDLGSGGRGDDARPSHDGAGRPAATGTARGVGQAETIDETPRRRSALGALDIAV